jgi:hypothetical protein
VPRWQSADRHMKLKIIMQDRPDLIESELAGLAFDSLQQVFKPELIEVMLNQPCPVGSVNEDIHVFIDPAAGGPYSDYAVLSITRLKGLVTVRPPAGPLRRQMGPLRHQGGDLGRERAVGRAGAAGVAAPVRPREPGEWVKHVGFSAGPPVYITPFAQLTGYATPFRPFAQLTRYAIRAVSMAASSVTISSLTHPGSTSSRRAV